MGVFGLDEAAHAFLPADFGAAKDLVHEGDVGPEGGCEDDVEGTDCGVGLRMLGGPPPHQITELEGSLATVNALSEALERMKMAARAPIFKTTTGVGYGLLHPPYQGRGFLLQGKHA